MAKKFDVSLVVASKCLSLPELIKRMGREPQAGSHSKGDLRRPGQPWSESVWRMNSQGSDFSLEEQCAQVLNGAPPECLKLLNDDPADISVTLDVAVYFQSVNVSLALPRSIISLAAERGVDLEVTCYPCDSIG